MCSLRDAWALELVPGLEFVAITADILLGLVGVRRIAVTPPPVVSGRHVAFGVFGRDRSPPPVRPRVAYSL